MFGTIFLFQTLTDTWIAGMDLKVELVFWGLGCLHKSGSYFSLSCGDTLMHIGRKWWRMSSGDDMKHEMSDGKNETHPAVVLCDFWREKHFKSGKTNQYVDGKPSPKMPRCSDHSQGELACPLMVIWGSKGTRTSGPSRSPFRPRERQEPAKMSALQPSTDVTPELSAFLKPFLHSSFLDLL